MANLAWAKKNICIVGIAGAGKTTLAERLSNHFNLEHVHSKMFWDFAETQDDEKKNFILDELSANRQLPLDIGADAFKMKIDNTLGKNGFIVDNVFGLEGYELFESFIKFNHHIWLDVDEKIAFGRAKPGTILEERRRIFQNKTLPLIELLKDKIIRIDANQYEDKVFEIAINKISNQM